jgi:hypothetical protein
MPIARDTLESFRLLVLDDRRRSRELGNELFVLAEFGSCRSIERLSSPPGEQKALISSIKKLRGFIEAGYPELGESHLRRLGARLFRIFFRGGVKRLYDTAIGAKGPKNTLPLELFLRSFELGSWPWEYLYDEGNQRFLCQEFYPITRGIFTLNSDKLPERSESKVHILLTTGVDIDDETISPQDEIKILKEIFNTHLASNQFELNIIPRICRKTLHKELLGDKYDILHFFGHGGFDARRKEGYLQLDGGDRNLTRCYATEFARLVQNRKLRLVFLNACESARGGPDIDPVSSSIAATLLEKGVPAIIATQFSMPASSAHCFASFTYNSLVRGKSVIEAVGEGRHSMDCEETRQFYDWGIPVLYSFRPDLVIFPRKPTDPELNWAASYEEGIRSGDIIKNLSAPRSRGAPSISVERTVIPAVKRRAKVRVALADIDANVGFLPDFVEEVNRRQSYYAFQVSYIPIPAGSFRYPPKGEHGPRSLCLYLPYLEAYLGSMPEKLDVDIVFCLTKRMVAQEEPDGVIWDYFSSRLNITKMVSAISTVGLRKYAAQANISFAKSVVYLFLAMLIVSGKRWKEAFHRETASCPLDYCDNRDDLVKGLSHLKFDHVKCRAKIKNPDELRALDAIVDLLLDQSKPFSIG